MRIQSNLETLPFNPLMDSPRWLCNGSRKFQSGLGQKGWWQEHLCRTKRHKNCWMISSQGSRGIIRGMVCWSVHTRRSDDTQRSFGEAVTSWSATRLIGWYKPLLSICPYHKISCNVISCAIIRQFEPIPLQQILCLHYDWLIDWLIPTLAQFLGAHPILLRLKSLGGNKTVDALLTLGARKRILLTGTPVQNNLQEFYGML